MSKKLSIATFYNGIERSKYTRAFNLTQSAKETHAHARYARPHAARANCYSSLSSESFVVRSWIK